MKKRGVRPSSVIRSRSMLRGTKKHLRKDIREARSIIGKLAKGVRRDVRALRSGRMGSPPEVHRQEQKDSVRSMRTLLTNARKFANEGRCTSAISALISAAHATGRAQAHESSWRTGRKPTVRNKAYIKTHDAVLKKCTKGWHF